MLVGEIQCITLYAAPGFVIPQTVPDEVTAAFERLVRVGYTTRLVQPAR